jgi:hypothetical protein
MKRTLQIIMLITSIIGLAYLVLSHFGYIRLWKIRSFNINSFLNNYSSLSKYDEKNRVVIVTGFTTDEIFIKSLLSQTCRVDSIVMILPYKKINQVPESIKKAVTLHGYSKQYSNNDIPIFVNSILQETEENTKIIIVEPNLYKEDFIQDMIALSDENPDYMIYVVSENQENRVATIIKPGFFNDKITEYRQGSCKEWVEMCCGKPTKTTEYLI